MPYIDIDNYEDVELRFNDSNVQEIINKVKRINERSNNHYAKEDIDNLEKSLKFLNNILTEFSLEAFINEVYVDECDLKELVKGNYDDGYDDAMQTVERERKGIYQVYGCLLQKLEHLAYGYGNQTPLTQDELKKIKEIIDDKA